MSVRTTRARLLGLGLGGLLALAACTTPGGEDPTETPEEKSSEASAAAEPTRSAADVEAAVLDSFEDPVPIAEAEGELRGDASPVPARVTVEAVEANETSTLLRFTVYGTTAEPTAVSLFALNPGSPLAMDVRGVTITEPTTGSTYSPYMGLSEDGAGEDGFCLCSEHPRNVDADGVALYSTFPVLPAEADEIAVDVPGFATLEGVPVTRD